MTRMISLPKKFLSYARSKGLSSALGQALHWLYRTYPRTLELRRSFDSDFYPVFICGVAGSGTTLLGALLDQRYVRAGLLRGSALRAPDDSPLKINSVASYGTLGRYYEAMFIPSDVPNKEIRASVMRFYRKFARYPKPSRIVIDKEANVHLVRASRLRNALPQSRFLLIFRDPVSNVEGLRRKWPVFGEAELAAVCDFWESVHRIFLEGFGGFASDVMAISFDELTRNTDDVLKRIAEFCSLQVRKTLHKYSNEHNVTGKGLRNIVNGEIRIVHNPQAGSAFSLLPEQCTYVRNRLLPMYTELEQLSKEKVVG